MKLFASLLLGATLFSGFAAPVSLQAATIEQQQALVERLRGYFLLAVEDAGSLWYVLPDGAQRQALPHAAAAFDVVVQNTMSVTGAQLALLPTKKLAYKSTAVKNAIAKYQGRFVSASNTWETIWYVNPADGLRYDVSTPEKAYAVAVKKALGISNANVSMIPAMPVFSPVAEPQIAEPVSQPAPQPVTYQNAAMGFEFASFLMAGYEQYHRAFNDWPDIKWFDNIVKYNLTIYLNEFGFSLDSGKQNFFTWADLSPEWHEFYRNHFTWKRDGDLVYVRFSLPQPVETAQYGVLNAGVYYLSNQYGLQDERSFQKSTGTYVPTMEEKKADAARVFEAALTVMRGLDKYNYNHTSFPTAYEKTIELGTATAKSLNSNGFTAEPQGTVYVWNIESGRPSTTLVYDSKYDSKWYTLTFTIYAPYKQYEAGVYVIEPYKISRVAPVPAQ